MALGGFRGPLEVRSKGGKDIVTQYDTRAEEAALGIIRAAFPGIRTDQLNAFASGRFTQAAVPAPVIHHVQSVFIGGLHELFVVGACVAAVGAVLALTLVRRRDFAAATAPAQG